MGLHIFSGLISPLLYQPLTHSALPPAPCLFLSFFLFFYLFGSKACRILVPGPEIKPMSPAVEARSLSHWTAREVPPIFFQSSTQASPLCFCLYLGHTRRATGQPFTGWPLRPVRSSEPPRGYQHLLPCRSCCQKHPVLVLHGLLSTVQPCAAHFTCVYSSSVSS